MRDSADCLVTQEALATCNTRARRRPHHLRTGRDPSSAAEVSEAVRALTHLNVEALRAEWRARYGAPLPPLRSGEHLRRLLAWRMQADVLGGLDAETRRALLKNTSLPKAPGLQTGERLVRVWQAKTYEVEVLDQGFRLDGRAFGSLSEVARKITGVRWNGPRFFGLRPEPQA